MKAQYIFTLPDTDAEDFTLTLNAGTHSLRIRFLWSFVSQTQDTILEDTIARLANTDPLDTQPTYTRDYDYVNYYLPFLYATVSSIETWLLSGTPLPVSLKGLPLFKQVELVQQRAQTCNEFNTWRRLYSELEGWQVTIEEEGLRIVGGLLPGAVYEKEDASFSIAVESLLDTIGREDLSNVTFRIEVEE